MGKERALQGRWCWRDGGLAVCAAVYQPAQRPGRAAQPHPGGGALRHRGGPVLPAALRGVLEERQPPRPVPVLPRADLRGVERLHDGQRLARPGLARGLPALRAPDLHRRRAAACPILRTAPPRARHNPFADRNELRVARSTSADGRHRLARPGSLLDGFCSRCHMPSNYVDNVPLHDVARRPAQRARARPARPGLRPHLRQRHRDRLRDRRTRSSATRTRARAACSAPSATRSPRRATRRTTRWRAASDPLQPEYVPAVGAGAALGRGARGTGRTSSTFPTTASPTWATAIGAGSFRLSPHAIGFPERLGPLTAHRPGPRPTTTCRASSAAPMPYEQVAGASKHHGLPARPADTGRDVQRLPRRDQPAHHQEPARPLGGRLPHRAHLHGVAGQPLRRPSRQRALRPRLQAGLPDLPHAAGLRAAGHRADALRRGQAARRRSREPWPDGGAGAAPTSPTTSWAATATSRRWWARARGRPAPWSPIRSCPCSASPRPTSEARTTTPTGPACRKRGPPVQQARLAWDRLRNVLDLDAGGAGCGRVRQPRAR